MRKIHLRLLARRRLEAPTTGSTGRGGPHCPHIVAQLAVPAVVASRPALHEQLARRQRGQTSASRARISGVTPSSFLGTGGRGPFTGP